MTQLRRLAQSRLDDDGGGTLLVQPRDHARPELRPELVDLRGHVEFVVDQNAPFLHVEVLHVDTERRRADFRGRLTRDEVDEAIGRLLDEDLDLRGDQILPPQLSGELVQFVEAHRRLSGRRASRDELPDVLFDVVQRRAILAALPDVREGFGELVDGAVHACRVAAGDDERALLAERLLHELNEPFAGLQRRRLPLLVLDQLIDDGMRRADEDEDRLAVRSGDRVRRPGDRQRHAGRFEAEARRQIDDPVGAVTFRAEEHVDAIRDQVVVGVGERAFDRVKGREIEVLFCAAARTTSRRLGRRLGRRRAREIDRDEAHAGGPHPNLHRSHVGVRQRPFGVARTGRLELVQRDLPLDDVVAVRHFHDEDEAVRAVRGGSARLDEQRRRERRRSDHALDSEELLDLVRNLVDRRTLLVPDIRQMPGEHHGRGAEPGVVPTDYRHRRLARQRERRHEAVARFQSGGADGLGGDVSPRQRPGADEDRRTNGPTKVGPHGRSRGDVHRRSCRNLHRRSRRGTSGPTNVGPHRGSCRGVRL